MLAFQKRAQYLALGVVEILHEEHGAVRVVDIRVVFRGEAVNTGVPQALLIVQCGVQVEAQVVAGSCVPAPATTWASTSRAP